MNLLAINGSRVQMVNKSLKRSTCPVPSFWKRLAISKAQSLVSDLTVKYDRLWSDDQHRDARTAARPCTCK
jgi:hypothetical protein